MHLMNTTPDGDFQTFKANDGAYVREHFFGRDPRTVPGVCRVVAVRRRTPATVAGLRRSRAASPWPL